jgi:hypothetical protein
MRARRTIRTLVLFALLVAPSAVHADRAPGKFYHLRRYAAQVPVDDTVRPKRNLLKLPELSTALVDVLGREGYARLLDTFKVTEPTEVVNGMNGGTATAFLVIFGQRPGERNALVAVDLFAPRGAVFVGVRVGDAAPRWYASHGRAEDLDADVRARL